MRAKVDTDRLLSLVLGLAVVWLVLEVASEFLHTLDTLVLLLPNLLGLAIVALIVLWWFDYI
jgi:hypothetical protein